MYVWGRRHQYVQMSFLGFFNFTAPYLPWVLLAFSVMLGGSPVMDLMGMGAGGALGGWAVAGAVGARILFLCAYLLRGVDGVAKGGGCLCRRWVLQWPVVACCFWSGVSAAGPSLVRIRNCSSGAAFWCTRLGFMTMHGRSGPRLFTSQAAMAPCPGDQVLPCCMYTMVAPPPAPQATPTTFWRMCTHA